MLDYYHETTNCGGRNKLSALFCFSNYAPGYYEVLSEITRTCPLCFSKKIRAPTTKVFTPSLKTERPRQRWYTDHTHLFDTGIRLLLMVDHFSKKCWGDITKGETAEEVIEILQNILDDGEPPPQRLYSDNGPAFKSKNYQYYLKTKDIAYHPGLAYWPQGQGTVERLHKTIKENVC